MRTFANLLGLCIMLVLSVVVVPDSNAQSISDCNSFSDVRPSSTAMSPREKCQCEIDSSYCIILTSSNVPVGSSLSRCQGKINVSGLGCMKCWKFSGLVVDGSSKAIGRIPVAEQLKVSNRLATAGRWAARLLVYGWCKLIAS